MRVVCLWSSIIPPSFIYWLDTRCFSILNGRLKKKKLRNENALKRPSTASIINSLSHAQMKRENVQKALKRGNPCTDIWVFLSTRKKRETNFHTYFWTLNILFSTLDILPLTFYPQPSTFYPRPSTKTYTRRNCQNLTFSSDKRDGLSRQTGMFHA